MLESLRKAVVIPSAPAWPWVSTASVAAFGWLLAQDLIHPVVVFLLQLYLTF